MSSSVAQADSGVVRTTALLVTVCNIQDRVQAHTSGPQGGIEMCSNAMQYNTAENNAIQLTAGC